MEGPTSVFSHHHLDLYCDYNNPEYVKTLLDGCQVIVNK